ncbi:hypothetical protein [Nibribacter koreensis]|uniref:hypothetical protein n=1 Tax=Nibribacter koreensis TaxID=1084519 RepID=UPI0031EF82E0
MNKLKAYLNQENAPNSTKEIILWWERRRLKFNLVYFLVSIFTLALTVVLLGYNAFFGFGLILMLALAINVCYCFGWLTEIILRKGIDDLDMKVGPVFLGLGTVFTVAVIVLRGFYEVINRLL